MTQAVPVPPVQIDDLRKVYRVPVREAGVGAAGGISFTVAPGEVVGFLGPNGAGKTTTLKMAACCSPGAGASSSSRPWDRRGQRMFHLIATYFRLGALNELQYRANFWINLLQSVLSLAAALASMSVAWSAFSRTSARARLTSS